MPGMNLQGPYGIPFCLRAEACTHPRGQTFSLSPGLKPITLGAAFQSCSPEGIGIDSGDRLKVCPLGVLQNSTSTPTPIPKRKIIDERLYLRNIVHARTANMIPATSAVSAAARVCLTLRTETAPK